MRLSRSHPGRRPRVAVTIGDPAGVGPEIALRLAAMPRLPAIPLLVGDADVLRQCAAALRLACPATVLPARRVLAEGVPEELKRAAIVDCGTFEGAVVPGRVDARCGAAAYAYLMTAIRGARSGVFDALVTAPLNKAALHAAGVHEAGHAEILARATRSRHTAMMLWSESLACAFVTCHMAMRDVAAALTIEREVRTTGLLHAALTRILGRPPRLAMLALNTHAGEAGAFGREEIEILEPALARCRRRGWNVAGPLVPDAAFLKHMRSRYDGLICQYHDQGHIPFKMLCFDEGVNVTLGLPLVRTSVDHGTAFDIAWQGQARPASLRAAFNLAVRLLATR